MMHLAEWSCSSCGALTGISSEIGDPGRCEQMVARRPFVIRLFGGIASRCNGQLFPVIRIADGQPVMLYVLIPKTANETDAAQELPPDGQTK